MNDPATSLHQVERALQESEARLQQVLDASNALIFGKDREGRYLFVNRAFEHMAGKSAAQIIGRTDGDVFTSEFATRFRHNDLRVLHEQRAIEFEEAIDLGGGTRTYLSSKFPLFDAGGVPYAVCGIATDITERKQFEDALSSSALAVSTAEEESLYRELVRYLATILGVDGAFIAVVDPDGHGRLQMLAFCLDGAIRENFGYPMYGTPCATVVGQIFRWYPRHLARLFPLDEDFRQQGFEGYAGYPLNDADGHPRGLMGVVSRKPLEGQGFVESVLRIFSVRTSAELDRARAAEALRNSEQSYREIFASSEDALFVHDWDTGAIVDVNPKACESYGYTREELLSLRLGDLSAGGARYSEAEALRWIEKAKHDGHARFEWCRRNRDGSLHWDEVCLRSARIAGRMRVLAFTREVTERRLQEQELRRSEDRLRATVRAALDCIVVMDHRGRVIEFNPAAEACFGRARESVLGQPLVDLLIPPRLREEFSQSIAHYLATGSGPLVGRRIETAALRADGSEVPVELAVGIAAGAEGTIFIGYLRDLSEVKAAEARRLRLEAQLRQGQKMQAIGQLTGGIAHDFNNLLTSIMGYVTLAAERQQPIGDARLAAYLAEAQRSCERARDLIQQMLTFSRGQRGAARVVSMAQVVSDSRPLVSASLPPSMDLRVEVADDGTAVRVDPLHLEQVLLNLCINARDAAPDARSLRVGVRRLRVDDSPCSGCKAGVDGEFVELYVEDQGHGMAPEIVERIFEPFFSTKEIGKGTGMGLAIVHGIVHEYGGHVLVETAPGQGSRFRVLFPAVPEPHEPSAASSKVATLASARPSLQGTVLVVDDETSVGEFMRELLETWGLRATSVSRPADALALVQRDPAYWDLVITDQAMPQMTGIDLARGLRALRPELPVVLYTGYSEGIGRDRPASLGVAAILTKPVDPQALRGVLVDCLAGRPPGKPVLDG